MNINNINSSHILKAIGEFDRLGRERFLANYGFGKAREYWLVYEGRRYDSKAIVGVGYQHVPGSTGPSTPADFVGGHATVQKLLEDLGFHVEVEKGERLEQG